MASDPTPGTRTTTATASSAPGKPSRRAGGETRWPMRLYKAVVVVLALAGVAYAAIVPMLRGTRDLPGAAEGQVRGLLVTARGDSLAVAGGLIVLFALYRVAVRAERRRG